ncbi:MAG: hypothetical protein COB96_07380 [Planctomycetota bacterium]|nr:MAG: hypothetical protein COB96_07380 [Planctomycetota bacterium]
MCASQTEEQMPTTTMTTLPPLPKFLKDGEISSPGILGHTSLQLHIDPRDRYVVMGEIWIESKEQSGEHTPPDGSFLPVRVMLSEICMCTEYSLQPAGQMSLPGFAPASVMGTYLDSLAALRCARCLRLRLSSITALST